MATFEFLCRKCKKTFAVPNLNYKESAAVFCVDCNTKDLELIGYSQANTQALHNLTRALADLETRVDAIIDFIQECAEADGEPQTEIPPKKELD